MASMYIGVVEEDIGKLRLSLIEAGMWSLVLQFHLLNQQDVDHEEFCQVARDHYQEAWFTTIHCLHLWIGKDHKEGGIMTIACILEPESKTINTKQTIGPKASVVANKHTLDSNLGKTPTTNNQTLDPESSIMSNRQTIDLESNVVCIDPLYHTSYQTQADALFRKNLTFQKRNWKTNSCMVCFPITLCVLLVVIQAVVNHLLGSEFQCGCKCVPIINATRCTKLCGVDYSDQDQVEFCEVPYPQNWPAILQVPRPEYRAIRNAGSPELQDESCRDDGDCGCTILYTSSNKTLADTLANYLLIGGPINSNDPLFSLASVVAGTDAHPWDTLLVESAFVKRTPIQLLQNTCFIPTFMLSVPSVVGPPINKAFECVPTSTLWSSSSMTINDELYRGFQKGNSAKQINEFPVAYDFGSSNSFAFDVNVWFNATFSNQSAHEPPNLIRVSRALNMASQAYLRFLVGPSAQLPLLFEREMPKSSMQLRLDFSSLLGPHFYMWVLGFLFPVVLTALVYEKQYHLRMMMKMHGLGDLSYWTITYIYFLVLFMIYMFCFILFGSIVGLQFFLKNDYSIQFVFSFLYINMIIAFGFLASNFFWDVKTATGYLYVFGSGLLGGFFFENFVVDPQTSRSLVLGLEIIPAFATYRGLYELSQYSFQAVYKNTNGMRWNNLKDTKNGLSNVFVILFMEWMIFMILTIYLDIVATSESGINKHPLFFLQFFFKRKLEGEAIFCEEAKANAHINPQDDQLPIDHPDVAREKKLVQELRSRPNKLYSIICDNLKKVYPAKDGNPPKFAVRTFSLAVARGECVGILGPNGAGKTSSINMMIGFLKPTMGTAYIQGMNILTEMSRIYSCMGVCPQHDLLWGQLTAREHLLFYGRLKNLSREKLHDAVEISLKNVNLFDNKVGDKQCRKYSGGMKRRLSVAISLIGNPQVVYMDEPSTGLDPASRYNLWNVIKDSKLDRAIILTTHSMEEAEALCDRVGIFVNGELQCIGNAKELRARFGGLYVLTITTPQGKEGEVIELANNLAKNAKKVYGLAGTQKFELPKSEVSIADVFLKMEQAKQCLHIQAWGLTDTTLEDVFIKVSKAGGSIALS